MIANLKNGNKRANGGKRKGAGRKPKAATILKRRLVENKVDEAEASFAFLVEVRDNSKEPIAQRMAAALAILDRVLGKPKEKHEIGGVDGGPIVYQIEYVNDWRDSASHVDVDVTRS